MALFINIALMSKAVNAMLSCRSDISRAMATQSTDLKANTFGFLPHNYIEGEIDAHGQVLNFGALAVSLDDQIDSVDHLPLNCEESSCESKRCF
jgi:hypothetical protein